MGVEGEVPQLLNFMAPIQVHCGTYEVCSVSTVELSRGEGE